jgi:Amidohydrolase family
LSRFTEGVDDDRRIIHVSTDGLVVTLNPAEHFRMADRIGSIAPGRFADILLLDDLGKFPPEQVFVSGRLVARRAKLVVDIPAPSFPESYRHRFEFDRSRLHSATMRRSITPKLRRPYPRRSDRRQGQILFRHFQFRILAPFRVAPHILRRVDISEG